MARKNEVAPGDIFIVNNMELHIARSDERDPSSYIFLNFDPRLLLNEEETLLLPFASPLLLVAPSSPCRARSHVRASVLLYR